MATQDGTMMSKKENDLSSQKVARAMSYFRNTQLRGEQAEERMLDEMIAQARAEKQQQAQAPNTASANPRREMPSDVLELLSPMNEQMTFEEYKQKVRECLMATVISTCAEERMKLYEDDLPQFYEEKWTPGAVAAALIMGA